MLQPENEDILPRTAPMPTIGTSLIETAPKPTVPEVSILICQPTSDTPCTGEIAQHSATKKSYSSWKKTLPKVICQASAEKNATTDSASYITMQNVAIKRSNVYPLRTIPDSRIPCNKFDHQCLESDKPSNCHTRGILKVNRCKQTLAHQQNGCCTLATYPQLQTTIDSHCLQAKVQTICSSTQTDLQCLPLNYNMGETLKLFTNLPTKQDYEVLLDIIKNMRIEQQRLMQICITLLEHECERGLKNGKNIILKEINTESVQDDSMKESNEVNTTVTQRKRGLTENALNQSPNPDAHSTKYRPNTPLATVTQQQPIQQNFTRQQKFGLHKPITEQSIVMNELALKYLPNDKLNDLLHDMRISPILTEKELVEDPSCRQTTTATILQPNGEIFSKGSSDISNASYTYLKKYQLLLEEHVPPVHQQNQNNYHHMRSSPPETKETSVEITLDLNAIRKQPKYL